MFFIPKLLYIRYAALRANPLQPLLEYHKQTFVSLTIPASVTQHLLVDHPAECTDLINPSIT